jgi:benzylmalate synthase
MLDITISDETFRDGEQQVGVNFTPKQKKALSKEMIESGVDLVSLMPGIVDEEDSQYQKIVQDHPQKYAASTLLSEVCINHSAKLGFENLIIFAPTSSILLRVYKLKFQENLKKISQLCSYAYKLGANVIFVAVDASRTKLSYLQAIRKQLKKCINHFIYTDTVGILRPSQVKQNLKQLKPYKSVPIGVHFHNDLGLANANTVQAVKSGASFISGTFGGIGERAGNADLAAVLFNLKKQGIVIKGVKYHRLSHIKKKVIKFGGMQAATPHTTRAFIHESGIHVHALNYDPLSFSHLDPKKYGHSHQFYFGKYSGLANYTHLFKDKYSINQLKRIRDLIKIKSFEKQRSFTEEEVRRMFKDGQIEPLTGEELES